MSFNLWSKMDINYLYSAIMKLIKTDSRSRSRTTWQLSYLIVSLLIFGLYAATLQSDGSWDLLNYHIYSPYALFHKPWGTDIVPAQQQTFLNPALDIVPYLLRSLLNTVPWLLNAAMATAHAVAVYLAFLVTLEVLPTDMPGRTLFALAAVGIGATGAATLPVLATTQSDMPATLCLLTALLLVLRDGGSKQAGWSRLFAAGGFCGMAFGLRLTQAPFCCGLAAVSVALAGHPARGRWQVMALFGLGGMAGAMVTGGPWWILTAIRTGNPLFPYYNNIFHSPMVPPVAMTDERFKPQVLLQQLAYPFFWLRRQSLVYEYTFRDPRFAFAYLGLVGMIIRAVILKIRKQDILANFSRKKMILLVFFAISYILWQVEFSIFRYLAPLELLTGTVMLASIVTWVPPVSSRSKPVIAASILGAVMVLLLIMINRLTIYPDIPRARPAQLALQVAVPPIPSDAMVILLDPGPMSYVAAYLPASVRVIGANTNFVKPGEQSGLARLIDTAIRDHPGPLYGLQDGDLPAIRATLAYHHLHQFGRCEPIVSNVALDPVSLCPLARDGG